MDTDAHQHAEQHHQHQAAGCQRSDHVVGQAGQRTQSAQDLQRANRNPELRQAVALELPTKAICDQRFVAEEQKGNCRAEREYQQEHVVTRLGT